MLQPQKTNRNFAILALVGGCIILVAAYLAFHKSPDSHAVDPTIPNNDAGNRWYNNVVISPTPTPIATVVPTPMVIPTPLPVMPYQQAQAPQTMSAAEQERLREYQAALKSDVTFKHQTQETPQLINNNSTSNAPIVVDVKPAPPYTIAPWTWIYAVLKDGINSDHSSDVVAQVSQNILDSATQTKILIPVGTILHGHQAGKSSVQYGDTGIVVTWDDMVFPNGYEQALPNMPATDTMGYSDFSDLVNHHYARQFSPALLISGISTATALTSQQGGAISAGTASLGGQAQGIASNSWDNLKPTLTIQPGYRCMVLVSREFRFKGPYQQ